MATGHYSKDQLDSLRKLQSTFDTEERNATAKEAQQVLIDDAGFAFLVYPQIISGAQRCGWVGYYSHRMVLLEFKY